MVITRDRMFVGLLALLLATPSAVSDDSPATKGRVTAGLQVLYDFQGSGPVVKDRSKVGKPLNLRIADMQHVQRTSGAIEVRQPTVIRSSGPAKKIIDAVKRSGEVTIEAWVRPLSMDQKGPARIVTISKNPTERNATIGQQGDQVEARLRTGESSPNGTPGISSRGKRVYSNRKNTHVVYTLDRDGNATIMVDGKVNEEKRGVGVIANWDDSFGLALANEITGDRAWLGEMRLVAIYSRALTVAEVARNFAAGLDSNASSLMAKGKVTDQHRFEAKIAPLLSRHCLECHDSASTEADLDLSRKSAAFRGGESGVAIVAGNSANSLLWKVVAEDLMPHDRPPLADTDKQALREWIDSGAAWTVDYIDPAIYRGADDSGHGSELWVQRLTLPQYIATVQATVDVDIAEDAADLLPEDRRADGFQNTAYNLNVDLKHVESYAKLAQLTVAKMNVDAFAKRFSTKTLLTDDHMRKLIAEMGRHVLRGPLQEREVVLYRGISTTVASAGGDFRQAVGTVLEAMLQSPRFLYRIENHRGDGSEWPVDQYELASRVSYIVWGAPPDKQLFAAAEAGELSEPSLLRKQVARMLDDSRAKEQSKQFVVQWLNLDRLEHLRPSVELFPHWRNELAQEMRQETIDFFLDVAWEPNRPLSDLLNAQFTYATPRLAEHYGFKPKGAGWQRYDLSDVPSRGGLLTQGSLLTIGGDEASMVTRGLFVLKDLLFSEVGDPPPGLDTTPVPATPGRSHRAIAAERVQSTSCGGCHARFEPLAYGLEMFDGLGSLHTVDRHGNRLRQDGEILFPGEANTVSYQSTAEMMDLLAGSDRVRQCLTRKLTQFSLGRPLFAVDAKSVRDIHQAAWADGGSYRELMMAIVLSDLVQKTRTEAESTERK